MHLHPRPTAPIGTFALATALVAALAVASITVATAAAPPALYTTAQAAAGHADFETHCSMCHGKDLQGITGPTLVGPAFASESNNYTVSAIFDELSQQMPAGAPGSLTNTQYADIMAFILSKNGYPAGDSPLTYDAAQNSTTKLISRVK
ncbi:MAG: cytochrome c [Acidiphilium sp.]|nr:cytochrome c [Acidiphilium sp.]MDD4935020.1 cytochrome c [Acidiphilium sp.]